MEKEWLAIEPAILMRPFNNKALQAILLGGVS